MLTFIAKDGGNHFTHIHLFRRSYFPAYHLDLNATILSESLRGVEDLTHSRRGDGLIASRRTAKMNPQFDLVRKLHNFLDERFDVTEWDE